MLIRVIGLIPWDIPSNNGGLYLSADNFDAGRGTVAACFQHWQNDTRVLIHPIVWEVTYNGLEITHLLDTSDIYERALLTRVMMSELGFSPGIATNPHDAKRGRRARDDFWCTNPPVYRPRPMRNIYPIGHVSYTDNPAFSQTVTLSRLHYMLGVDNRVDPRGVKNDS